MSIFQHFRPDEHDFVEKVLDIKEYVMNRYVPKRMDFLDPRQQQIVSSVIGGDLHVQFFGGSKDAERKRAILCPDYFKPSDEDFQVILFEIQYPNKFVTIEHPNILGALMNIGLKREKFGDIITDEGRAQVFIASEVKSYVQLNVTSIGKVAVQFTEVPLAGAIVKKDHWAEKTVTVSSLRLDVILAETYHLSRQKVLPYIKNGLVKVNFKAIDSPSFLCKSGDYLSMRGYGRSKLIDIEGQTKKEKWRLKIGVLQ